ncbi:bifunctional non-homologous end joining protein LigD [Bosea lupini]|uniref:Bifunctional non-homologous end joining protein LigD n=1 Tax=Bosea lupini TaxID=1036779 RepID=A0A1H7X8C6_9HYPH|nr:bifunctional non-homologous end joining protein LigD [Bosea lupini]
MPAIWRGRRGRAPEIGGLAEVKIFASDVAKTMEQAEPKRFTATLSKKARNGRIFVDYLRNAAAPLLSLPDF